MTRYTCRRCQAYFFKEVTWKIHNEVYHGVRECSYKQSPSEYGDNQKSKGTKSIQDTLQNNEAHQETGKQTKIKTLQSKQINKRSQNTYMNSSERQGPIPNLQINRTTKTLPNPTIKVSTESTVQNKVHNRNGLTGHVSCVGCAKEKRVPAQRKMHFNTRKRCYTCHTRIAWREEPKQPK